MKDEVQNDEGSRLKRLVEAKSTELGQQGKGLQRHIIQKAHSHTICMRLKIVKSFQLHITEV